jgi:DNA helicase II / ATP-dependent DNA helicase PcrA
VATVPVNAQLLFGPPGTGKTAALLQRVEQALESGVEPQHIAFVSFTKAAAEEAVDRAVKRFNIPKRQLKWFRTLHSMAFSQLGIGKDGVLADYNDFGREAGLQFTSSADERGETQGDQFLMARSLSYALQLPFKEVKHRYGITLAEHFYDNVAGKLSSYKLRERKVEFGDMLESFLEARQALPVTHAFIDEAQDLTPQQWQVVDLAFSNCEQVVIAGDDDQAIYHWAGADVNRLLTMPAQRIVLANSHRVPRKVHQYAQLIAGRISQRQPKHWHSREEEGAVERCPNISSVSFDLPGTYMVLARNRFFLQDIAHWLRNQGYLYTLYGNSSITTQEQRAYEALQTLRGGGTVKGRQFQSLLDLSSHTQRVRTEDIITSKDLLRFTPFALLSPQRRRYIERAAVRYKDDLSRAPNIELSTIHQAKGKEADYVVVSPDITRATAQDMGDAEHRAFYVAVTRPRKVLFLLRSSAEHGYKWP